MDDFDRQAGELFDTILIWAFAIIIGGAVVWSLVVIVRSL